jgi:ribosomal protein S18 acetylase RimI-like enzyme
MVAAMKIRVARPDEYDAIGTLTVEAYRDLTGGAALGEYEDELYAVADRAVDCAVLVAVDDDDIVLGAVTYVPGPAAGMSEFADADAAGIRMLAVAPMQQGNGVGRALTEACIARARSDGRHKIVLHSTEVMTVARSMYERLGFVAAPERDVWFTEPPYSVDRPLHLIGYVLNL